MASPHLWASQSVRFLRSFWLAHSLFEAAARIRSQVSVWRGSILFRHRHVQKMPTELKNEKRGPPRSEDRRHHRHHHHHNYHDRLLH